jgi:16S rRNA (cytosine967-C5)-methyltransferase
MSPKSANPRLLAVRALRQITENGQPLDAALNALGDSRDRPWLQELLYGVLRHYYLLNAVVGQLLNKPLKDHDHDIHLLLLVGLYELAYMDTKAHAAVNETVAVTRVLKKNWASGLVNACLRRAQREHDQLYQQAENDDEARYDHPDWLIRKIRDRYPDSWQAILEANNQRPPMHIRVNSRQIARDDYLARLQAAGIAGETLERCADGIVLTRPVPVTQLPGFGEGQVSVQDGAAQLAAALLDLAPGQRILDACAAPGGKACHILEREPAIASLQMVENSAARAERIGQNLARLGLTGELHVADASAPDSWWDGVPYQRILLDAPCSATGVIRRHPDIKLHRTPEQIASAVQLQARILDALWPLLDSGGKLLYVTCSIMPEENELQLQKFLSRHDDASEVTLNLPWAQRRDPGHQILPGSSGLDGFYYGCIQKR